MAILSVRDLGLSYAELGALTSDLISVSHAAAMLGRSQRTVFNYIDSGKLKAYRIHGGDQRFVSERSVASLVPAPTYTG